jgi:archaemetzincin
MMDAKILPVLPIMGSHLTTRKNPYTRNRQILTRDILILLKKRRPPDAFCVLAITMEDLYPAPSWNFVFGQASHQDGVGVFSFARYDPVFYGEKRRKNFQEVLLRRSCKVLAYETGHMFSLAHCIYFQCLMNGSNHLQESDARPLSLCPVCLRKLQFSIGFDVVDRYGMLLDFYQRMGFENEAEWVLKRLKWLKKSQFN